LQVVSKCNSLLHAVIRSKWLSNHPSKFTKPPMPGGWAGPVCLLVAGKLKTN